MSKPLIVKAYSGNETVKIISDPPSPAHKSIPDWYKKIPRTSDGGPLNIANGGHNLTVKACMPYLDAMTAGYMVNLWCDIQVTQSPSGPTLNWTTELPPISPRPASSHIGLKKISGFSEFEFAWNMPWGIKPPKGYSVLITQPLNRTDLPFFTTSGIVDADNYAVPGIATFSVSLDFEGIIKEGTPILQIIPIKRHEWKLEIDNSIREEEETKRRRTISIFTGAYKKRFWEPKKYE